MESTHLNQPMEAGAMSLEDEAGAPVYRAVLEFSASTKADLDRQERDAEAAACDAASLLASSPRH